MKRAFLPVVATMLSIASESSAQGPELKLPISTFGTPGLIDMPTGQVLSDGELVSTLGYHQGNQRYTLTFQITPRLFGSFRYVIIDSLEFSGDTRYDRSFDLGYQLMKESRTLPSVVIGLRDFGGTGIYGSEFIAATKHFAQNRLSLTGGIGWGRLGSHGSFKNPLSIFADRFNERDLSLGRVDRAGKIDIGQWFHGPTALFGGLAYQVTPELTFKAEYSSDAYALETERTGFKHRSPFNFALTYAFKHGDLTAYYLHGSELGFTASFTTDPKTTTYPTGIETSPPAVRTAQQQAGLSWDDTSLSTNRTRFAQSLQAQGLTLEAMTVKGSTATIRITNGRYPAAAQALGRAARLLANTLPASVKTFDIVLAQYGMPISQTRLRRQDLEELEFELDGAWETYARAQITSATPQDLTPVPDVFPKLSWSLTPYLQPELFDPDDPVRADLGLQAFASYEPFEGFVLSGTVRKPVVGNLSSSNRPSNSILPHVRTDVTEYIKQSDFQIKHLTAEYFFRPGKDLFGRVSAGYLETMYGGISTELLWKPVDSPLALGAEVNFSKQREFDQLFGFRDYDIVTGHASAYYDFGGGYLGQVDAGRYLAGDWGATFSLDREFNNGFKVGAFFTLTDVPFDDFGEGAFDKGIRFSIPITWIAGAPSKDNFSTTVRPVLRDGGARLDIRNRLYEVVRGSQTQELEDRWGRFWR